MFNEFERILSPARRIQLFIRAPMTFGGLGGFPPGSLIGAPGPWEPQWGKTTSTLTELEGVRRSLATQAERVQQRLEEELTRIRAQIAAVDREIERIRRSSVRIPVMDGDGGADDE
jgi:hypothetical protein